ncbi:uncharacterized protein F5Z01DRAFT_651535 [Emericellopsis atlantica]|uniref:Uncharacterized protein n=1 Tax=Emericellopsis atlantica TaxID=2614577 RepID=A0A9P7ZPP1_9HYPO|nr:uncharacterized protein F5Z01DRAFT_651535 [Emericellopsis atlantica]KAG9255561.1 hypothetical protein F5Z01DRAFT_651535 [Emericellopsis atlantica]
MMAAASILPLVTLARRTTGESSQAKTHDADRPRTAKLRVSTEMVSGVLILAETWGSALLGRHGLPRSMGHAQINKRS